MKKIEGARRFYRYIFNAVCVKPGRERESDSRFEA